MMDIVSSMASATPISGMRNLQSDDDIQIVLDDDGRFARHQRFNGRPWALRAVGPAPWAKSHCRSMKKP